MKSLADTLAVSPARSEADRASIAASWDELAEALEDGRLSERQFAMLTEAEPPEDADALVVNLWARQLRRCARDPGGVGTDLDAWRTWPCRCGPGRGWLYTEAVSPVSGQLVTYAEPCRDCNPRQRTLWLDCWTQGGDHRCPQCWRNGGRTATPNGGDRGAEARAAEAAAAAEREADEMFAGLR